MGCANIPAHNIHHGRLRAFKAPQTPSSKSIMAHAAVPVIRQDRRALTSVRGVGTLRDVPEVTRMLARFV